MTSMTWQQVEPHTNALPIKERIKWYQDRAEEHGTPISWNQAKVLMNSEDSTMYQSEKYTVMFYQKSQADHMIHVESMKGMCDYISLRTNDRSPVHSWTDLQEIKNHFCGEEREALEIYPRESRKVDAANQYHLIVMPEGWTIPFGFSVDA